MRPANCAERRGRRARVDGHAATSAERFAAEALPHLEQLYPAALRMADVPSGAESLVMETYARAYALLAERGDASITAWLYRNMARVAEESGLARRSDPVQDAPEGHEPLPRLDEVPGGAVTEALQQLPAWSRFAVYLADVEGFSSSAIARIMRLPVSAVVSRLHHGHRQLRAALAARA